MIERDKYYRPGAPELRPIAAKQTFARWRYEGIGPSYIKMAGAVLYKGADLLDWLDSQRVTTDRPAREEA